VHQSVYAQKYFTKEGRVSFYSQAPLEDIEAHNEKATAVLDLENGEMEWALLIKAFTFQKALMQEHFNENYMESSKFPKAIFKGQIVEYEPIAIDKNNHYTFQLKGELTIHGITQPIETAVVFDVKSGKLSGQSQITVKVEDYDIDIPSIVREKIAKEVRITISADFIPLSKS
jgi:hypothetical protein